MNGKKIDNATLAIAVIILGLMIVGIITAGDEEESWNGSTNARRFSSAGLPGENARYVPPTNFGMVQQTPYWLAGGTPPQFANIQAGSPVQQRRIPSEGVWMGMEIEGLSPGTIRELGLPKNQTGVIVDSAPPGSIAERAGLRNGDIIKAINGQIIVNMADYIKATKNQKIKSAILEIDRGGRILYFAISPEVTLREGQTGSQTWINTNASNPDTYTGASPNAYNKKATPPITLNSPMPHAYLGVCVKCHKIIPGGRVPLYSPAYSRVGTMNQSNYSLPNPAQQKAAQKVLVEGHWLGMELIPITQELAWEYKLPAGVAGLLVDEVTLEAAESGLLAGDVLQSINNIPIKTLEDFRQATRRVESLPAATLGVVRNGNPKTLTLRSSWGKLGVAQNEAAQPIQPGAISPHKNRGRPCTDCHIIMKNGGQLQTDAGDILPVPPPITANLQAPHSYRGLCNTCHAIIQ